MYVPMQITETRVRGQADGTCDEMCGLHATDEMAIHYSRYYVVGTIYYYYIPIDHVGHVRPSCME